MNINYNNKKSLGYNKRNNRSNFHTERASNDWSWFSDAINNEISKRKKLKKLIVLSLVFWILIITIVFSLAITYIISPLGIPGTIENTGNEFETNNLKFNIQLGISIFLITLLFLFCFIVVVLNVISGITILASDWIQEKAQLSKIFYGFLTIFVASLIATSLFLKLIPKYYQRNYKNPLAQNSDVNIIKARQKIKNFAILTAFLDTISVLLLIVIVLPFTFLILNQRMVFSFSTTTFIILGTMLGSFVLISIILNIIVSYWIFTTKWNSEKINKQKLLWAFVTLFLYGPISALIFITYIPKYNFSPYLRKLN
ncbi:hypothetical protein [[Mycoplasma] mobile]|uniref:Expressed protein n=1 Tax=Mycoplasma mobile (strain ATCC 43663 / 163K / NCTC 11711) TaxID=267748 RepID=Q6KH29_MYCM1|nr:hypothetical protein [[Mycoplasma] mobile]AAT28102.1 expressed protein [Mycoplasma mobile 163K]